MPSSAIRELKKKRDEILRELQAAQAARREAEERFKGLQKRFLMWQDMFETAMEDEGLPPEKRDEVREAYARTPRGQTIHGLAADLIHEHGPQTSAEIRRMLTLVGKETTTNTVTVTLNRHSDIFKRVRVGGELKWDLTKKEGKETT